MKNVKFWCRLRRRIDKEKRIATPACGLVRNNDDRMVQRRKALHRAALRIQSCSARELCSFALSSLQWTSGRCLKIVKETIERQRLFHLAKIVEKGDLFKP
ncbi:MAG: hypothetical protein IKF98_11750 [Clostridia bacterium]|nr:hypothetical protein [Clostridia bacterium]